ncbi:MAG: phosphonatase-like hydrolase [Sphingobacteriia bacterium]|jgi:phosphonatase-like hydrolase|nr:MAG: phosphonatase-like hydrolase [Sphingobacteriia bacterium]
MIKMVVFDMAGTTINEDNIVYKTLQQSINNAGFNCTLEFVLTYGAGKEKRKAISDIVNNMEENIGAEKIDAIFKDFQLQLKTAYSVANISAQPDALMVFDALHKLGIKIVLNTGYDSSTAFLLLNELEWEIGHEIDLVITASDVANGRPAPDMILLAMQEFGITNAAEVAKVGDSMIDIEEGLNAGCNIVVGITTGAHNYEQLLSAKPTFIIHRLSELIPILT